MKFLSLFVIWCLVLGAWPVFAFVMSSDSYRIQQDSVNIGGTEDSVSNSYKLKDTAGEIATGKSTSDSYNLYAGYRQMNETYISISSPANVTLTPAILGVTGGTGSSSAAWTIITDNPAGYSLTIKASSSPALVSGDYSFADYTPSGANPDFTWSVALTDSEFGFTPEGNDIVDKFRDSDGSCNAVLGGDTVNACWYYMSTTVQAIAQSTSANHPSGAVTTVKFRATSGSSHIQVEGTYTATTTVTALTL